MSGYSEDDIRRAAEIREWLVKQIAEKQEEVDRLRRTLAIIDGLLKQGSFKAAASISSLTAEGQAAATAQVQSRQTQIMPKQAAPATLKQGDREIRPLKRAKDDFVLANAEILQNSVVIVPVQGVSLNVNTPPFRSFFLNRILDGMKAKDAERIAQGTLKESEALSYSVEDDNGMIKRIVINNYRERERLTEIFNTSSWVFTRMLEKSG